MCASGAAGDRVRLTHADQTAAKRDLLRLSDLPPTVTWKAMTPNSNGSGTPAACSKLNYSGPQIVDTGQAKSQFSTPGVLVMNQVDLVSKTSMVHLIWKHVFGQSLSRCVAAAFSAGAAGKVKVLSSRRLAFLHLAKLESTYRILFQITVRGTTVRGACDLVVMAGRRTISMLFVMGILGTAKDVATGEIEMSLIDTGLAQKLASRAFGSPGALGFAA